MRDRILIDTGPIVAFLDRREARHPWVRKAFQVQSVPFYTNELVLAEAVFLLRHHPAALDEIGKWIVHGYLRLPFRLEPEAGEVFRLMAKYRDLPMSLADAGLVRMVETGLGDRVFTLDHHFRIYRHSGRLKVPVLMPD